MSVGTTVLALLLALFFAVIGAPLLMDGVDTGNDLRNGAVTSVVSTSGSKISRHPVISVDGVEYHCSPVGTALLGAEVRYAPDDPSNCRIEATIGERSLGRLAMGAFFCVMGLIIAVLILRPDRASPEHPA